MFYRWRHFCVAFVFAVGNLNAQSSTLPFSKVVEDFNVGTGNGLNSAELLDGYNYTLQGSVTWDGLNLSVDVTHAEIAWVWSTPGYGIGDMEDGPHSDFILKDTGGGVIEQLNGVSLVTPSSTLVGSDISGSRIMTSAQKAAFNCELEIEDAEPGTQLVWRLRSEGVQVETVLWTLPEVVSYRLQSLEITNDSELWRTAGIFVLEYPGVMFLARRMEPGETYAWEFLLRSDDASNYYAAFVDAAASNAAGAVQIVSEGENGLPVVVYDRVVPDETTATPAVGASDGSETMGSGWRDILNPAAQVPGRVGPPVSTSGDSSPATNEHLSQVGNAITETVQAGDSVIADRIQNLNGALGSLTTLASEEVNLSGITASRMSGVLVNSGNLIGLAYTTNEKLSTIGSRLESANTRLASLDTKLTTIRDALAALQTFTDELDDLAEDNPSLSEMQSGGVAAGAEIASVYGSAPTGKGYTLSPGGAPALAVTMPVQFGGQTFDLNPFQSGRFATVCAWFRAAVAWLVIGLLGAWVWAQVAEWTRGFATLRQAHGNAVIAGTGSQATALTAAGLITVAVVSGTTALLSWSFDGINFAAFVATSTSNPMATVPTGVLWMLDQLLPVSVIITAFAAKITFNLYASTVFATAAAVVRFIVP